MQVIAKVLSATIFLEWNLNNLQNFKILKKN